MKQLLLVMAVVMVGCGTTGEYRTAWQEEMDAKWIPRVGHATYAKALTELGPPTSKEIDEGHTYARWRNDYVWHNSYTGKRTSKRKEALLVFGPNKLLKSVRFTHGRYMQFDENKKILSDLFVSMLNAMNVPTKTFADSKGHLDQIFKI